MSNNDIYIYIEPDQVTDLAIELSQVDGIETQVKQEKVDPPDYSKEHPAYHLDPTIVVTVVVSITSLLTGFLSLAKALLDYLAARNEAKSKKLEKQKESILVINNSYVIRLSESPKPAEIADYFEKNEIKKISFE